MRNEMDIFRGMPGDVRDLFGLSRRFNRLFDEVLGETPSTQQEGAFLTPRSEIEETSDGYVLALEMPGVPKDSINVEVTGNRLRISGEKKREWKGRRKEERGFEQECFEQMLTLPENIDPSRLEAEHRDGVLYLSLPRGEAHMAKRVPISSGEGGFLSRLRGKVAEAVGKGTEQPREQKEVKGERAA